MRQYHDPIHYEGYRNIAKQIAEDLDHQPIAVIGGVGSGASTGGLVTSFRDSGIDVLAVGIQPFGSVTFGSELIHDPEVIIAGIGSSIPFENVHYNLYDEIHWLSFNTALSGSVALLKDHALFAGLSSGAAYAVARYTASKTPERQHIFVAADTGHRYVDAVFARHEEATLLADLSPIVVDSLSDLTMPWSSMTWNRRSYEVLENICL
jgi:cysteine synthase A